MVGDDVRVMMVFVDGFGLGLPDSRNPFLLADIPSIRRMLGPLISGSSKRYEGHACSAVSVDATLGVPGLPQSATGQATLLTGVNAPQFMGKHINAFPTGRLETMLKQESIFVKLVKMNFSCTFANAFRDEAFQRMREGTYQPSATTVAVSGAGLPLRSIDDLRRRQAVYQDITNESLIQQGYDVPSFTPQEAGSIVGRISSDHDFTLFEYFQTDRAGHSGDMERAVRILELLDAFLGSLLHEINLSESCVLLVSDHGNIEDMGVNTHTLNPVPVAIAGGSEDLRKRALEDVGSIMDVPSVIMRILGAESHG